MPACRFRVRAVTVEPNVRGQEMRRVHLSAVDSDAFSAGEKAEKVPVPAAPDGAISILVNREYAKRFQVGDEFDVAFHETA